MKYNILAIADIHWGAMDPDEMYDNLQYFLDFIRMKGDIDLVVICGEYMYLRYDADPSRIAAQLLSGIGFIGAGTILRDGFNVKGLTTAASLLAVTCIGLCIGAGFYFIGIVATVILYIVLSYSYLFTDKLDHFLTSELTIGISGSKQETIEQIQNILDEKDITIKRLEKSNSIDDNDEVIETIKLIIRYNHNIKISKIINTISNLETVCTIEED